MPLYQIEYSDQKWIKVTADDYDSFNVLYKIPYSSIKDGKNLPVLENRFIVYILQAITTDSKDYIYVGKSKKALESRPDSHDDKLCGTGYEWSYCYILTRTDSVFLNDGVIQHLEHQIHLRVKQCNDRFIDTTEVTQDNTANERDVKKSANYLKDMYSRLFVLGLDLTSEMKNKKITDYGDPEIPKIPEQPKELCGKQYHLRSSKIKVHSTINCDGTVHIPRGTPIVPELAPSFKGRPYQKLRDELIKLKIISKDVFTQDYTFQSPSAAAAVILGRSANGKIEWVDDNGKTYKDNLNPMS